MLRFLTSQFAAVALSAMLILAADGAEIVAHRGASHDRPENTLASVNLGWEQGDAVEIDIHLTGDGQIVVIHDPSTKRTAGKELVVAKSTLAALRELEVGSWKATAFAGEKIPTLDEVLKTIPADKRLFIEIKTGPEILPELKRVLDAAALPAKRTPLIGFSYDTMKAAKELLPHLKCYWLAKVEPGKAEADKDRLVPSAVELIQRTKAAKLDGLDLGNSPPLTTEYVQEIQQSGLELYVWTVNDAEKARAYETLGILGITTDRPALMKAVLGAKVK